MVDRNHGSLSIIVEQSWTALIPFKTTVWNFLMLWRLIFTLPDKVTQKTRWISGRLWIQRNYLVAEENWSICLLIAIQDHDFYFGLPIDWHPFNGNNGNVKSNNFQDRELEVTFFRKQEKRNRALRKRKVNISENKHQIREAQGVLRGEGGVRKQSTPTRLLLHAVSRKIASGNQEKPSVLPQVPTHQLGYFD